MRDLLGWAAATGILGSLRYAPMPAAQRLARLYTSALDKAQPRLRRAAYRNLAFAMPGADARAITDGVFGSIARMLVSFARFPDITRETVGQWIRCEGLQHYRAARERGRGVLIPTAHLGNWELSAFAHALMTEPMHVVVRPLDNARVDAVIEQRRALSGNHLITKRDAARPILRALGRGDAVGILIDQNVLPHEGAFIDFFGKRACAGTAFAKLAQHSGAAVVPGFALWSEDEQRYVLRFHPELPMAGDVLHDTQCVHSMLESVIRAHPDQWLWIHRRWKTRPAGEPPLY